MSTDYYEAEDEGKPRRSLLSFLFLPTLAFAAGVAAMGWVLAHWTNAASFIGVKPEAPAPVEAAMPAAEGNRLVSVAPAPVPQPVVDVATSRRVDEMEAKLAQIDTQTRAAVGNADRAEGLLIAFAARRALDRGVRLDYLEGLLRQRFGATQPEAVATILTASRQPVTLQELQEGLDKVGSDLTGGGPQQGWWSAFKTQFDDLVTIRQAGAPSAMPTQRLARATAHLEAGQVDIALTEVVRMPGREKARDWIVAARRYVAARHALDTIETAALLEPRVFAPIAQPVAIKRTN
jgi:hypothetical protein